MTVDVEAKFGVRRRKVLLFVSLSIIFLLFMSLFTVCVVVNRDDDGFFVEGAIPVRSGLELKRVVDNAPFGVSVVIALTRDVILTDTLVILADKNVTLVSNSVDKFFKIFGNRGATIWVEKGGYLRIDGVIVTHTVGGEGCGVEVNGGVFVLSSGEISGNTNIGSVGGVRNGGTFIMLGGAIINNIGYRTSHAGSTKRGGGVYNSGNFTMMGGEISNNTVHAGGGGVTNSYAGVFDMYGGIITNNRGGVRVESGTFNMYGGEITNNYAYYHGGGVYVEYIGVFNMFGGKITSNVVVGGSAQDPLGGGGVHMSQGVFSMFGGEITGNEAYCGGGVHIENSCVFDRQGGVIVNNTATSGVGADFYRYHYTDKW